MDSNNKALDSHLETFGCPAALRCSVLPALIHSINLIGEQLRSAQHVAAVGSANAFGDEQLNVDVLAEKIIRTEIAQCLSVTAASSEEDPVERSVPREEQLDAGSDGEQYSLAFDPLDGSSIIAPNWTVGTIIGVWSGPSALHAKPSQKQVASLLGVFGPRTTVIVAIRAHGRSTCFELGLGRSGDGRTTTCEMVRQEINMLTPPFKTRYFAPANLRAAAEDEKYRELVNHYIREKYTLRYSGGLVPDVVHALVKGHGVYVSPVTAASKAKLRRLYELAPIALIMECAGASAIDPATGEDVLSKSVEDTDERGGLICGNVAEVAFVKKSLGLT